MAAGNQRAFAALYEATAWVMVGEYRQLLRPVWMLRLAPMPMDTRSSMIAIWIIQRSPGFGGVLDPPPERS